MNTFEKYQFPATGTQAPVALETADATLKDYAMGAFGNMAGGAFNTYMNGMLQERQFQEQEKLQRNAYKYNQMAVKEQAANQVYGMQNAGLNPAGVTGAGAPSIQAGAAAGSGTTIGNIFTGIAEIIAAAKAPSEIQRNQAEAIERSVETTKTPIQIAKMAEEMGLFAEQARSIKNENEFMEAHNRFLKEQAPKVFENYIAQMRASGVWNNLPQDTRETYEKLAMGASGIEEYGMGLIRGINDVLRTHKGLSDADKAVLDNTKQMIIDFKQITDNKTMEAFASMPKWQQELMKSQITDFYAQARKAGTEANWNITKNWIDQHTNDQWLIEHGLTDEIERKKYGELLNRFLNLPFNLIENGAPAAIMGGAMRGTKIMELNSKTQVPEQKIKIHTPDSYGSFSIGGNTWR